MRQAAIIETLLDTDFYKFTMARYIWATYSEAKVRYAMRCRSKDPRFIERIDPDVLAEQIAHVRTLKFHDDELAFLRTNPTFPMEETFLRTLQDLRLTDVEISLDADGLRIETAGRWSDAILWETFLLSIVNELYARGLMAERGMKSDEPWDEGDRRLQVKIDRLKGSGVRLIEFGTRRRFCRDWQEHVVNVMTAKLPNEMLGTSNVALAKRYGLPPVGTMAHELFMIEAACSGDALRASQAHVLDTWHVATAGALSIALTDTFGTEAFFRDFREGRAAAWKGVRHDSGDPAAFGERVIRFYEEEGIDPASKTIVFSDGLDVEAILALQARFNGRIGLAYGWGTNLTNDVGLPTLSLVVKAVEADGHPTVKLSDDEGKHTGPPDEIARYIRVFS